LEEGNKFADVAVVGVERSIVVPTTIRYSLTGDIAKKLTQAKSFSNSPSGTSNFLG
jgi:hypothetical protein